MESIKKTVKDQLTRYLEEKKLRKTPERYAILQEIYSRSSHFTIDMLFQYMYDRKYRVSRATLYNTMELLLECGLVEKHIFEGDKAFYERAYPMKPHDHLICVQCGKIEEFTANKLDEIKREVAEEKRFEPVSHVFYIYGICATCKGKKKDKGSKY